MINNDLTISNYKNNSYSEFKQPATGYLLTTKKEVRALHETPKERKSRNLTTSIVAGSLVAGFGSLALLRGGFPKYIAPKLNKFKLNLEQKIANQKAGKSYGKLEELSIIGLRGVNTFLEKAQSINNLTSWKDIGFKRLMCGSNNERPVTSKIYKSVTKLFENIGSSTVSKSYSSTNNKFFELNRHIENINLSMSGNLNKSIEINGVKKPLHQWLDEAGKIRSKISSDLENGFGHEARASRYRQMKESCIGIVDYFLNTNLKRKEKLIPKEAWQNFIADNYVQPKRMQMSTEVAQLRQIITHNIADNYNSTMKALADVDNFINPADKTTREIVRKLRNSLAQYKKLPGDSNKPKRLVLNSEMIKDLQDISASYANGASKFKYSDEQVTHVAEYINEVDNLISKYSKGPLQELLTIYKNILPEKEYLALKNYAETAIKSLDKSIDKETVQFFGKLRDLEVGSAPTDVLSILLSIGAIGYGMTKAHDNEERISLTLKAGIPVVSAVATSLYCSAGLLSGSKALFFSAISGFVMNRIGKYIDEYRKEAIAEDKLNLDKTQKSENKLGEAIIEKKINKQEEIKQS